MFCLCAVVRVESRFGFSNSWFLILGYIKFLYIPVLTGLHNKSTLNMFMCLLVSTTIKVHRLQYIHMFAVCLHCGEHFIGILKSQVF